MDCLFCRIIAGEIGSRRVWSDDAAIAFLDIAGWQRGHTLVVPRRHVANLTDDPTALAEIAPAITAVASLLQDRLGADAVNLLVNSGPVAGQEVFHLHAHVVPRYATSPGLDNMIERGRSFDLDEVLCELTE